MIEKIINSKCKWLVILKDNSKWVVDFENNLFDSYEWYSAYGTLENELNFKQLKRDIKVIKRI